MEIYNDYAFLEIARIFFITFFQNSEYSGKQEMQIHQIARNICFLSWRACNVITNVTDPYRWKTAFLQTEVLINAYRTISGVSYLETS